jgi:rhamnulokinase
LTDDVVTSHEAFAAGMCNEMTFGSLFLCRNIMGLWILQQARAAWLRQGSEHSYGELARLAAEAPPGGPLIYPDDECFLAPEDMLDAIGGFCGRTGQETLEGVAAVSRCILESLAFCFRHNADRLAEILDRRFSVLHVVGGGTHNELLCQLTADVTGMPVVAGPAEATVTGNLLVQAAALGYLEGPEQVRQTVRESFQLKRYEPRDRPETGEHYERYLRIVERVG